jgi:serine/threonine protein kinase
MDNPILEKTDLVWLDQSANHFEDALRSGETPRIEDHLATCAAARRPHLFKALLELELSYLAKAAAPMPTRADYVRRFPQFGDIITSAFADILPDADSTGADLAVGLATAHDESTVPVRLGKYPVRKVLGRGNFGTVYLADDTHLGREVAIKVPLAERLASPGAVNLFVREAAMVANLDHPGLVPIYDFAPPLACSADMFVVMKYIRGSTLAHQTYQSLPHTRVAEIMIRICHAVHYAHTKGLVHRDLKTANILMDQDGRPYVADFGLAIDDLGQCTRPGELAGSPGYMSPEQVRRERLDGRSDIWSLGVILYQLLTGRSPFNGIGLDGQLNREVLFREICFDDPKPLRQINDVLPKRLERICLTCLTKDKNSRYTTAQDVAADLEEWVTKDQLSHGLSRPNVSERRPFNDHPNGSPLPASRTIRVLAITPQSFAAERTALDRLIRKVASTFPPYVRMNLLHRQNTCTDDVGGVTHRKTDEEYDILIGVVGGNVGAPTACADSSVEESLDLACWNWRDGHAGGRILFCFLNPQVTLHDQNIDDVARLFRLRRKLSECSVPSLFFASVRELTDGLGKHLPGMIQNVFAADVEQPQDRTDPRTPLIVTVPDTILCNNESAPQGASHKVIELHGGRLFELTCTIRTLSPYFRFGFKFLSKTARLFGDGSIKSQDSNLVIHVGRSAESPGLNFTSYWNGMREAADRVLFDTTASMTAQLKLTVDQLWTLTVAVNGVGVYRRTITPGICYTLVMLGWGDHKEFSVEVTDLVVRAIR